MNMHTDPGWWLVYVLYGVLATLVLQVVIRQVRLSRQYKRDHGSRKQINPRRCRHNQLRFHSNVGYTLEPGRKTMIAVCLDCGTTNVEFDLRSVHKGEVTRVMSEMMTAKGYDQDPIETNRWTRA